MDSQKWTFGDVVITGIVEQGLDGLNDLIADATPEEVQKIDWLAPNYANNAGEMSGIIQSFVIQTPNRLIVVDTCVGDQKERVAVDAWHRSQHRFLDKFRSAGFDPDKVDIVLCTHLHVDHVGWNTKLEHGKWVPTFPNARYLFSETEFSFWETEYQAPLLDPAAAQDQQELAAAVMQGLQHQTHADSVMPIFKHNLADLVQSDHKVCEGVSLVPTPGHTPGHVSVHIHSGGQEALITGDCFHHPCQIAKPKWGTLVDYDTEQSTATRQSLCGSLHRSGATIIGSHFSKPSAGKLEQTPDGYKLIG